MTKPIRPTSVQKWTRCPQLWAYEDVEGWRSPREEFNWPIACGKAIHAGIAEFWRVGGNDPEGAMLASFFNDTFEQDDETREHYLAILPKVLVRLILWCGQHMSHADTIAVEVPLEEDGHTTPDLIAREDGGLTITDWKLSETVEPSRVHYKLAHPEHDHQFQHYVWRVQEIYQKPVVLFRKVVIAMKPKPAIYEATFVPTPEMTKEWLRGARIKWHQMEQMRVGGDLHGGLVWRNENGCFPYGEKYPCPMLAACWDCHGDREQMAHFYVKGDK